jgi:hypothetical protein
MRSGVGDDDVHPSMRPLDPLCERGVSRRVPRDVLYYLDPAWMLLGDSSERGCTAAGGIARPRVDDGGGVVWRRRRLPGIDLKYKLEGKKYVSQVLVDSLNSVPNPRVVPVIKKMVVVDSAMDRCAVDAEHLEVVYILLGWERSELIYSTSRQARNFVIVPVNWCLRMNTRIPKRNPMQVRILL